MSAINVNSITGRTGSHGPVLTGVTTAVGSYHVTGAGSSVGIGTDDPTYKLDIRVTGPESGMRVYNPDSSALASGMLRLGNDTNANSAFLQLNSSNNTTAVGGPDSLVLGHGLQKQVHLASGGVSRLTVDVGGNIGIGTTTTSSLLTLDHPTNPAIQLRDSGTKVASINAEGTQTNVASFEGKDLVFAASNSSAFTERVRITGIGGSVGIGTESPTTLLEVGNQNTSSAASLTVSRGEDIGGGTGPIINLKHGPAGGTQRTHQIYSYTGDLRIVADSNEDLELWTGGAERFTINSSGDIATGDDSAISRKLVLTICYSRLVSHSGCNSNGPSGTFTEFDNGDDSFTTVQKTVTSATSGFTFVGDNGGRALAMFVGCGDNPYFSWIDASGDAPNYWSWVLINSVFTSAVFGLPTNTTRTSLP